MTGETGTKESRCIPAQGEKIIIDASLTTAGPVIITAEIFNHPEDEIQIIGDIQFTIAPEGSLTISNLDVSQATHADGPVKIQSDQQGTGSLIHFQDGVQAIAERYIQWCGKCLAHNILTGNSPKHRA
jgi:hypothetical protein